MALLTPQGVKEVFQLQLGRDLLRRLLRWEPLDEWSDPRGSILLDALYDCVLFAAGKGFPWVEVARVVKFTDELLVETKGCSSITEAVTILGNKLVDYQRHFTARDLLALCDYSHNTFIRHFRLYQYVLGQARTVHLTVTHLEVCTPPQPLPLAEGMHRDMWNHQQQVAALEATEEQKRRELRLLREALREEEGRLLEQTFASMQPQGTEGTQPHQGLCREALEHLVHEAVGIQIKSLGQRLQCEVQMAFNILDLRLQKQLLSLNVPLSPLPPSPGQLGPENAIKSHRAHRQKKARAK
uniref:Chromosome 8 open reading frame 74 n=1 Tax=Cavia porcellus TaxID=10141 RepID=H0V4E6_CAVPO